MNKITTTHPIYSEIENKHYSIITGKEFFIPELLKKKKQEFDRSWKMLKKDNYLKEGKKFRYRQFRYFHFLPASGEVTPFARTSYYQPPEINQYAAGIDRKFDDMAEDITANVFLRELIKFDFLQLPVTAQKQSEPWLLDIHLVRIVTTESENGEPTPEGIHHDENDFVCIHMIKRENITGGINSVYSNNLELLESCTLNDNMDSIILCDPKVMHGVTPIFPTILRNTAYRLLLNIPTKR